MAWMQSTLPAVVLVLSTSWLSSGAQLTCSITSVCPSTIVTLTCEKNGQSLVEVWTVTDSPAEGVWTLLTTCRNSSKNNTNNGSTSNILCTPSGTVHVSNIPFENDKKLENYTLQCGKETMPSNVSCALNVTDVLDCPESLMPTQTLETSSLPPASVLLITLSALAGLLVIVSLVVLVAILLLVFWYLCKKHSGVSTEHKNHERTKTTKVEDATQESASGSSLNAPALSSKKLLFSFSAPQLHVTPKELKQSPKSCKYAVTQVPNASPQQSPFFHDQKIIKQGQAASEYMVPKDVVVLPKDDISKKSQKDGLEPIYAEPIPLANKLKQRRSSDPVSHQRSTRTFDGEHLADMPGYSTPPEVHRKDSADQRDSGRIFSYQGEIVLSALAQVAQDGHTYDTIL